MSRRNLVVQLFLLLAMTLISVAAQAAEPRVIELTIRGGALPENQRVIRVQQGDEVTLRWTTDKALTIHLHGYDIEKTLSPNAPTTMQFSAKATGRFAIEIHHGSDKHGSDPDEEVTIGYLEVHPR